uniref:FAD dependent oxidoreductase domain-containing protein n=1 Tax=Kalanchoe fedtschenkoi TaxID=63787 RepID=A0A7N0TD78_KALFE
MADSTKTETPYDAVVIGAGVMGSTTAYNLAKRGHRTLLLEQFDFLHHRGSSHGESRTIRATYPEAYYAAMVADSARLWTRAEAEIGYRVYFSSAQLDVGPAESKSLSAVIANCKTHGVPHQILYGREVGERFKGRFNVPEGWVGLVTELGGVIKPTKAVAMFQALALKNGAVLKDNVEVSGISRGEDEEGLLEILTSSGERFRARKCVVAAGAWMRKLVKTVAGVELPIQPLECSVCYWRIQDGYENDFSLNHGDHSDRFPTFASYGDPYVYGTPSLEYPGLIKAAVHNGTVCDPDRRDWGKGLYEDHLRKWIEERFEGRVDSSGPVSTQSCMYSMTPDEDFVIDFIGGEFGKDLVVGGGFSGHGFKMAPLIGRVLADLVMEGVAKGVEMEHFRIGRFDGGGKGNVKEFEDQVCFAKFN